MRVIALATLTTVAICGCAEPGANLGANVYSASQVNARQAARVVAILMVAPAKVEVDNTENKKTAQLVGALLGAAGGAAAGNNMSRTSGSSYVGAGVGGVSGYAAGSLVASKKLIDGVSITYTENGQTYNSAQVGRLCEYTQGNAVVIATSPTETRIQANATCPTLAAK